MNNYMDILFEQIKSMVLNKPIDKSTEIKDSEYEDLEEAIFYLSDCIQEVNTFTKELSCGNLGVSVPSRRNFIASGLKDLHSGLKHLTWQTSQVAIGDYNHKISFMGDFSVSFNKMIEQLKEREEKLLEQSNAISDTLYLLISIMDSLPDWVLVSSSDTSEVLYVNKSASKSFYNIEIKTLVNDKYEDLFNKLTYYSYEENGRSLSFEYNNSSENKTFLVSSYLVLWNNERAYVHYIRDFTAEKHYRDKMELMAYKDVLTGLYNRRYFMNFLQDCIKTKISFSLTSIDLDGLKYVNDNFGHLKGDEYIITFTKQLQENLRSDDIFARTGGDEFLVICINCEKKVVDEKFTYLNKILKEKSTEYPMSVSFGTKYVEGIQDLIAEDLLEETDKIMYEYKKTKKNFRAPVKLLNK